MKLDRDSEMKCLTRNEMSEKPILFSAQMVRAILEGRKTQTRRVVKPQPCLMPDYIQKVKHDTGYWWAYNKGETMIQIRDMPQFCPYGKQGDLLWVRETWCSKSKLVYNKDGNLDLSSVWYEADGAEVEAVDDDGFARFNKNGNAASPWRPSIFMPRWASRITLRVVSVRVQRLLDITESDATAEGFTSDAVASVTGCYSGFYARDKFLNYFYELSPDLEDKNPWVWAIKFEAKQSKL